MLLPISAMSLLSATEPMNRDANSKIARHAILALKTFMSVFDGAKAVP